MVEFKPFEKEIVSILAGSILSDEEQSKIFAEGECWLEENHEVGYFINVRHLLIPERRIVIDQPTVITEVGECCVGFVIFIADHELAIDACAWGETNVPPDFREKVRRLKVGKLENGQFVERQ
jgi:hypothetical protein